MKNSIEHQEIRLKFFMVKNSPRHLLEQMGGGGASGTEAKQSHNIRKMMRGNQAVPFPQC